MKLAPKNMGLFGWMFFSTTFLTEAYLLALGDLWMVYEFSQMRDADAS